MHSSSLVNTDSYPRFYVKRSLKNRKWSMLQFFLLNYRSFADSSERVLKTPATRQPVVDEMTPSVSCVTATKEEPTATSTPRPHLSAQQVAATIAAHTQTNKRRASSRSTPSAANTVTSFVGRASKSGVTLASDPPQPASSNTNGVVAAVDGSPSELHCVCRTPYDETKCVF
jgi:hypothetical protein